MSLNKLYQILLAKWLGRQGYKKLAAQPLYRALARGLTFTYFTFSLVAFWSTWKEMAILYSRLGLIRNAGSVAGDLRGCDSCPGCLGSNPGADFRRAVG